MSSNVHRTPARVAIRKRGEVECEWCSCDGTRYVRLSRAPGYAPSEDWLDVCDDCARELREALTRGLKKR